MSNILLHNGEFMTLLIMALALGMDAFSLGLGMGMLRLRTHEIARISGTIGVFHVFMPLLGMVVGLYLSSIIGDVTRWVGALLLIGLGGQMIWNSLFGQDRDEPADSKAAARTSGIGLFLFALSVSLDSLSVGFSLGTFGANIALAVTLFGICGALLAALGLAVGGRVSHLFGEYGEVIGGGVLIAFGLKFLF
ncbi:manganese efflux pump MntP family protein [Tumebacillus flagellatus]|uniref:Putative manganese efflux pump MntP n=1 Tax=Tumebacillus flagellatus TaxID=1157490 RepID=A0A074LU11_9BACL|nr:manganese efflux pump [Tumebacillus flagellatus]KEO83358.1 membrane protein [Tumebacillus flagellatus]